MNTITPKTIKKDIRDEHWEAVKVVGEDGTETVTMRLKSVVSKEKPEKKERAPIS